MSIYKLLTIVWNTLHGQGPQYLHDKLKVETFTRTTRQANSISIILQAPFNQQKILELEASATHLHTTGMHYHHLSNLPKI